MKKIKLISYRFVEKDKLENEVKVRVLGKEEFLQLAKNTMLAAEATEKLATAQDKQEKTATKSVSANKKVSSNMTQLKDNVVKQTASLKATKNDIVSKTRSSKTSAKINDKSDDGITKDLILSSVQPEALGQTSLNSLKQNVTLAKALTNSMGKTATVQRLYNTMIEDMGISAPKAFQSLVVSGKNVADNLKLNKGSLKELEDTFKQNAKVAEDVNDELEDIGDNGNIIGKTLSEAFKGSNEYGKKFENTLKSISSFIVRIRIVGGFLRNLVNFFGKMYDKSAEYTESLNLYTLALGEYAKQGKKWAEEISNALYLDPTTVLQYTGAFYNLVNGLGVAKDAAYLMATNLTQLSLDMASYLNISNETAYEKLTSAITGQSRAVVTAGVAMQVASLQELAYSLGIKKKVNTMTQAEKTYLRYIQIMRSTSKMQKDLGRTIITPANAMRVFKNQATLMVRALGNIVTVISIKVMPYLIALTELIQDAANAIAKWFGYDSKLFDTDTSGLKEIQTSLDDTADSADGAGNSINRTLAAFDDLNVVESASASSSGSGGNDSVLADLEKYITGYDMLEELTDTFKKNVDSAKETLKGLLKVVGAVVAVVAMAKIISSVSKLVSSIKIIGEALIAFSSSFVGVMITAIAGLIFSFLNLTSVMKDAVVNGFDLLNAKGIISTLTMQGIVVALLALSGHPVIAAITGIVLLISDIVSAIKGVKQGIYENETAWALQQTQMDKTGVSLDNVVKGFEKLGEKQAKWGETVSEMLSKVDDMESEFNDASQAADALALHILFDDYKDDIQSAYTDIETYIGNLKSTAENYYKSKEDYELKELENLAKEGAMTKETYQESKKAIQEYYDMLTGRQAQYSAAYSALLKKKAEGKITDEEYNKELKALQTNYADVAKATEGAGASFGNYAKALTEGINISGQTADQIQDSVDKINNAYNQQQKTLEDNYKTQKEYNDQQKAIAIEQRDLYKSQMEQYEKGTKEYNEAQENFIKANNEITRLDKANQTLYANWQLEAMNLNYQYRNTMQDLKKKMDDLGISSKGAYKDVSKSIQDAIDSGFKYTSDNMDKFKAYNTESGTMLGIAIGDGLVLGMENGKKAVYKEGEELGTYTIASIQTALDVHSPSKLTEGFGENVTEGLAIGLVSKTALGKLTNSLKTVTDAVKKSFDDINKNKISISGDVEGSFNNILNKLQTFCNNWRNAINNLAKGMTTTMNGISINKDGKVNYTSMPKVTVAKFAEGGMPNSGDLFFANENGAAEYITSIGNRTAVANQDQMVQAISGAITRAMGGQTQQPGNVVVYIGNDKVYEGQGTYQSRQSDRYGTTYVKI